ncbi:sugar transferase [candidate division KSB1 bacterium]|nr:sugar transferase [candidate division KSB1 bacterium]
MRYKYHNTITFLQMLADLVTVNSSWYLSYWLWFISPFRLQEHIIAPSILESTIIGLVFIIMFFIQGGYKRKTSIMNLDARKNLIGAMMMGCGLVIIYSFFLKTIMLGRLQIFYFFFTMFFCISMERYIFDHIHIFLLRKNIGSKRVLIFGAGETGIRLAKALQRYPKLGYLPIGFVDDYITKIDKNGINPLPILGTSHQLEAMLQRYNAEEIIIAIPSAPQSRIREVMQRCSNANIPYRYVPNLYDTAIQRIRTDVIDGVPVFGMGHLRYTPFNAVVKRLFDIAFSIFIIIFLSPMVAVIGAAIRLDSTGPVFFKQQRVGQWGRLFIMWKFRTMKNGSDPYAVHPHDKNDGRITRVGRWLRRMSMDELPQFLNVLRGDMSIVGPRPEMPFIVKEYNDLHRERLNVRPGITGLWQISADRGLPIHENIDHDLFYIQHQSFILDLLIIGKTFWVALSGLGR